MKNKLVYEDIKDRDIINLTGTYRGRYIVRNKYIDYKNVETIQLLDNNGVSTTLILSYINENLDDGIDDFGYATTSWDDYKVSPNSDRYCHHDWVESKWFVRTYKTCKLCDKKWEDM